MFIASHGMDDNIRFGRFVLDQFDVVLVPVDKSHAGIGRRYFCAFFFTSDQTGPFPVGMGVANCVENIAADEAGSACPRLKLVGRETDGALSILQEDFRRHVLDMICCCCEGGREEVISYIGYDCFADEGFG